MANAKRVRQELEIFVADQLHDFTQDLANDLEAKTPIDTGFARASWRPSSGVPGDETPEHPDFTGLGRAQAAAKQKARQNAAKVAFGANQRIEDKFITNNATYIEALNAGHSPQAPAGFVEGVIDDHTS